MRDAFEQACYQHYLEQHKAGKHGGDTPMALSSLMWRQANGQYGVLAFNSAWFGWESAANHLSDPPHHRDAWSELSKACARVSDGADPAVLGQALDNFCDALMEPEKLSKARRAQDAELRAAISELRTALGNPVIGGEGVQTVASQTVRAAVVALAGPEQHQPDMTGAAVFHLPALMFTIVAKVDEYRVDFTIYEIIATDANGGRAWQRAGAESSPDFVYRLEEAQVFAHGRVKWDGCSDWTLVEADMLHGCSREDLSKVGEVLAWCWDFTSKNLPTWDE